MWTLAECSMPFDAIRSIKGVPEERDPKPIPKFQNPKWGFEYTPVYSAIVSILLFVMFVICNNFGKFDEYFPIISHQLVDRQYIHDIQLHPSHSSAAGETFSLFDLGGWELAAAYNIQPLGLSHQIRSILKFAKVAKV